MYLSSNIKKLIFFYFILQALTNLSYSKDMNAQEFYKSCSNYFEWVNKNYSIPLDEETFFNMGKCQGVIETIGKTMLTLCYETKRNANINRSLTANLEGVKTITIIKKFLEIAVNDVKLRNFSSHSYLLTFISNQWPCK